MKKILGLPLFLSLIFTQVTYNMTPSPQLIKARRAAIEAAARNKQEKAKVASLDQDDSAVLVSIDKTASKIIMAKSAKQEKSIYVSYKDDPDSIPFSPKSIEHSRLLKSQQKLDLTVGTPENPLLITRGPLCKSSLNHLRTFLDIIVEAQLKKHDVKKVLLKALEKESKENLVHICNAALYCGIKLLIEASIEHIKEIALKDHINNKDKIHFEHLAWLQNLPEAVQKQITPLLIRSDKLIYKSICDKLPKVLTSALSGYNDELWSICWSPNGKYLAACTNDNTIRIWDSANNNLIRTFTGHTDRVNSISWSPASELLASASEDGTIRIWNVKGNRQVGEPLTGHTGSLRMVSWSPNGARLISHSINGTVGLWNAANFSLIKILGEHISTISDTCWSPDGKYLASSSPHNKTIHLWDAENGRQIGEPLSKNSLLSSNISWSPDGNYLAFSIYPLDYSEDRAYSIQIWNVRTRTLEIIKKNLPCVQSIDWAPDSRYLVLIALGTQIRIWDIQRDTLKFLTKIFPCDFIKDLEANWSSDGTRLASVGTFTDKDEDNIVQLWDAASGAQIVVPFPVERAHSPKWSPDGTRLAISPIKGAIEIVHVGPLLKQEMALCSLTIDQMKNLFNKTARTRQLKSLVVASSIAIAGIVAFNIFFRKK